MEKKFNVDISARAEVKADLSPETQKEFFSFVQRLLGPVAEASDFLAERIRLARFEQAARVFGRARQICEQQGIEPTHVPLKTLVPLLESASLETEEPELTELWAQLLASAAKQAKSKHLQYVAVLNQIDAAEATLLMAARAGLSEHEMFRPEKFTPLLSDEVPFWKGENVSSSSELKSRGRIVYLWHEDNIANTNEFSLGAMEETLRLLHLEALGLMKTYSGSMLEHGKRIFYLIGSITPLGFDFVTTCTGPAD